MLLKLTETDGAINVNAAETTPAAPATEILDKETIPATSTDTATDKEEFIPGLDPAPAAGAGEETGATNLPDEVEIPGGLEPAEEGTFEPLEVTFGTEGRDDLEGTESGDLIFGEAGRDTIAGEAGDDNIFGGDGRDEIDGGAGDDLIDGGAGRDTMTGGEGSDTFELRSDSGDDTITDFHAGAGTELLLQEGTELLTRADVPTDVLDFSKADGVESIEDLEIEQVGEDTVIHYGDNDLTLEGVDASSLTADNFKFEEPLIPNEEVNF